MLTNRFALLSIEGFFKPGFSSLKQKRLLICRKRMQLKMSYHLTSSLNRHFAELFQQHYHKFFTKLRFRKTLSLERTLQQQQQCKGTKIKVII